MIRIYVFVSGLVLFQFATTPGGSNFAILAAGDYDFPGLAKIEKHTATVHAGQNAAMVTPAPPVDAKLSVDCDGQCTAVTPPPEIASLDELMLVDSIDPAVKAACLTAGGTGCPQPGCVAASAKTGVLEFTGRWKVQAVTDCGTGYPNVGQLADINFVRSSQAWKLRYLDEVLIPKLANGVLFTTTVRSMDELTSTNSALKQVLSGSMLSDCTKLPGYGGEPQCAAIIVRNGAYDPYIGGGDLHFAALYAMLQNDLDAAKLWLPIAGKQQACTDHSGAGCGGYSTCVGGRAQ